MIIPEASLLGLFVVAALVLLLTPGPAVLYIVTRSVEQGRLAGLVSALGVHAGTLVHVAAAALGVSALLVSSALAFDIVKYLGALYLIYLGVRKLAMGPGGASPSQGLRGSSGRGAGERPAETALFFWRSCRSSSTSGAGFQILILGLIFVALGCVRRPLRGGGRHRRSVAQARGPAPPRGAVRQRKRVRRARRRRRSPVTAGSSPATACETGTGPPVAERSARASTILRLTAGRPAGGSQIVVTSIGDCGRPPSASARRRGARVRRRSAWS